MNNVPRRIRLDLNTPAELSIVNAMQEVDKLPPDTRLTNAIILLAKAKELVSDFVDNVPASLSAGGPGDAPSDESTKQFYEDRPTKEDGEPGYY